MIKLNHRWLNNSFLILFKSLLSFLFDKTTRRFSKLHIIYRNNGIFNKTGKILYEYHNDTVITTTTATTTTTIEGVGKSSLISTFVSRHFSEVVPGIMTRVRLPPAENSCITTIVDSQGGDAALISAVASISTGAAAKASNITAGITSNMDTVGHSDVGGRNNIRRGGEQEIRMETAATTNSPSASNMSAIHSSTDSTYFASSNTNETLSSLHSFSTSARRTSKSGIESVDSIILIYDLDRDETFFRLENHWLPLIERCYNGGVSIVLFFFSLFFRSMNNECCFKMFFISPFTLTTRLIKVIRLLYVNFESNLLTVDHFFLFFPFQRSYQ